MHTLLLLRHANADSRVQVSDHDRPLTKKGIKDAPNMAKRLVKQDYKPDLIISSSALRAVMTAEIFADTFDSTFSVDKTLYNAHEKNVIDLLHTIDDKVEDLMLVGHNPTWEIIVEMFTGQRIQMHPCSIAQISFDTPWSTIKEGKIIYLADIV